MTILTAQQMNEMKSLAAGKNANMAVCKDIAENHHLLQRKRNKYTLTPKGREFCERNNIEVIDRKK